MILETMRDALRNRIGVPAMDQFYTDPQLDDLINEALQAISLEFDWPWLQAFETINTIAGTRFYTPNANWTRTKAISIQGFDAMTWLDLQMMRNWPDDVRDVPVYYTIWLEQIYLAPAPSAIYALRHDYVRTEPRLIDNSDTPLMPSIYQYSILAMACHLAYLRSGDLARAQAAQKEYETWKARMADSRREITGTIRPRTRPGRDL